MTASSALENVFSLALWLAGAASFCVLGAGAQVPLRFGWKQELSRLSPINRKLMWVYYGFIGTTIVAFGVLTLVYHDDMLRGDVGSILQMPGIGIVAVGTAKQAARHEQHDPEARAVVSRRRFIGVDVAESTIGIVVDFTGIWRVRRDTNVQIVPAARRKVADPRHGALLRLRSGRGRCG